MSTASAAASSGPIMGWMTSPEPLDFDYGTLARFFTACVVALPVALAALPDDALGKLASQWLGIPGETLAGLDEHAKLVVLQALVGGASAKNLMHLIASLPNDFPTVRVQIKNDPNGAVSFSAQVLGQILNN
jgi:hypothetical protein